MAPHDGSVFLAYVICRGIDWDGSDMVEYSRKLLCLQWDDKYKSFKPFNANRLVVTTTQFTDDDIVYCAVVPEDMQKHVNADVSVDFWKG